MSFLPALPWHKTRRPHSLHGSSLALSAHQKSKQSIDIQHEQNGINDNQKIRAITIPPNYLSTQPTSVSASPTKQPISAQTSAYSRGKTYVAVIMMVQPSVRLFNLIFLS